VDIGSVTIFFAISDVHIIDILDIIAAWCIPDSAISSSTVVLIYSHIKHSSADGFVTIDDSEERGIIPSITFDKTNSDLDRRYVL